ncbi:MAG: hypothetical protein GX417_04490 [Clostridiales bacterium]|nr:hypothetical protein [Clostridiales bacterium]
MRVFRKRKLFRTRTPEQVERAYRQMLAEQAYEKSKAHWFFLRMQTPGI